MAFVLSAAALNESLAGNAVDILAAAAVTQQETAIASLARATALLQTVTDTAIADANARLSTLVTSPLLTPREISLEHLRKGGSIWEQGSRMRRAKGYLHGRFRVFKKNILCWE